MIEIGPAAKNLADELLQVFKPGESSHRDLASHPSRFSTDRESASRHTTLHRTRIG
jgi:hypothetical protein